MEPGPSTASGWRCSFCVDTDGIDGVPPQLCVSLELELLSLKFASNTSDEDQIQSQALVIEHAIIMGQPTIPQNEPYITEILAEYPVADSLWMASTLGDKQRVRQLLPFWSHPPLALLVHILPGTYDTLDNLRKLVTSLYPTLAAGGPLPIGSKIYEAVSRLVSESKCVPGLIKQHFKYMHYVEGKVPTLPSLSRVSVPAGDDDDVPQKTVKLVPYCGPEDDLQLDTTRICQQLKKIEEQLSKTDQKGDLSQQLVDFDTYVRTSDWISLYCDVEDDDSLDILTYDWISLYCDEQQEDVVWF